MRRHLLGLLTLGSLTLAGLLAAPASTSFAQDARCGRLEAQLRSLDGNRRTDPARLAQYRAAIERQDVELRRTADYYQSVGCDADAASTSQCRALDANIQRIQSNLASLGSQLDRISANAGLQHDGERERIMAMLGDLGCGEGDGRAPDASRSAGMFEQLFGPDESSDGSEGYDQPPSAGDIPPPDMPEGGPDVAGSSLRTICVRKCDGFFFPVSFATNSSAFPADEQSCRSQCPAADVELYAYDTYSQQPDDAVSASTGAPLRSMPNAFKFRTQFDQSCSCTGAGQATAQSVAPPEAALKRLDDKDLAAPAPAAPAPVDPAPATALPRPKKPVRVVGPSFIPAQ